MADSQEIVSVLDDGRTDQDQHEDWHTHGCASLDIRTGGLQSSQLGGMRAVLTSVDRCWEPGQVRTPIVLVLYEAHSDKDDLRCISSLPNTRNPSSTEQSSNCSPGVG